jgi:hypothetical protein
MNTPPRPLWLQQLASLGIPTLLLLAFLLFFPKGGIKPFGIPLSWGTILLAVFAGIAACNLAYYKTLSQKHLIAFLYTLPFPLLAACSIMVYGSGNLGFTISLFYCFLLAPLAFIVLFEPYIKRLPLETLFRFIDYGVLFVAAYGILLFFYKYVFGEFFTIPFLTVNIGDVGMLELKHIDRGGIFKLISTYNNGNVYGVAILMLLPLFHSRNSWWKRWIVKTSLILTLSRTVWIGLLVHELIRLLWGRISFQKLVKIAGFAAAGIAASLILLPLMGQDSSFLLDANFGGRLNQILLLVGNGIYLFPHKTFSVIAEIAYVSILDTFGVLGLIAFLSALLMPLWVAVRQRDRTSPLPSFKKDILFGLGIYLLISASDSATLYIPVMLFYWFGVAVLLREEAANGA